MPRSDRLAGALVFSVFAVCWSAASCEEVASFGTAIPPSDRTLGVAVAPDGKGLPPGHGTAASGGKIYAERCASCHGEKLQGVKAAGGPQLVGGRGTLTKTVPTKTVESYWPYATTLFDYVKRAMPFNAPGSLSEDDVYAVTAYILAEGKIIDPSQTMDAASLPKVRMPNAEGFIPDPRPLEGAPR